MISLNQKATAIHWAFLIIAVIGAIVLIDKFTVSSSVASEVGRDLSAMVILSA